MPKANNSSNQFQFNKEAEEPPISFKEKWTPKIRYALYVIVVFSIWLTIIGVVYWTYDQARKHIKLVDDVP